MTGPTSADLEGTKDLGPREILAVVPLIAALVFFGFYPAPLLDAANPMVGDLLEQVGVTDDPPTVDPADVEEHDAALEGETH